MDTLQQLKAELANEYQITRNFIALFPVGKNEYAPHQ